MLISNDDLRLINEGRWLWLLGPWQLVELCRCLGRDLAEARDFNNQNPSNSSRPPSSRPPWESVSAAEQAGASAEELEPAEPEPVEAAAAEQAKVSEPHPVSAITGAAKRKRSPRRAGKQPGAPGFGRTVELPVTAELSHRAERCGRCGAALDETAPFSATTGLYVLDLEASSPERPGLILSHTKHLDGETRCGCGHTSVTQPGRSAAEAEWSVGLSEWHLVGPLLASLIACLSQRMRASRTRTREFLAD